MFNAVAQAPKFKVIAFYTGRNDQAHISFVNEANRWFPQIAARYKFSYDATTNLNQLSTESLKQYQTVLFLDTRPEVPAQRRPLKTTWSMAVRGWDFIFRRSP